MKVKMILGYKILLFNDVKNQNSHFDFLLTFISVFLG